MNILYLITRAEQGGAQTKVLALAKHGLAQGHRVRIGIGESGWLSDQAIAAGVPTVVFRHLKRTWSPFSIRPFLQELRAELERQPADILHMHSSNTLFATRLRNCMGNDRPKAIATVCGLSLMHPGWTGSRIKKFVFNAITKRMWARCDHVIFVCEWDRQFALSKKYATEENSSVVYNGLPAEMPYLAQRDAKEKLNLLSADSDFVVGTVARLDYQKDIDLFIDMADTLRAERMRFRVVGAGPDHERLTKKIRQLGLSDRVEIIDRARDAFRLMTGFDVFVLTSRYEGFPWTLLEAAQARVPIVSMAVAGCPEIITDGETGRLVHDRAPQSLAKAVRAVRDNPEQSAAAAERARAAVRQKFSQTVLLNGTYSIYKQLLPDG